MDKVRARVLISGRVQGVCFRMYTETEALNRRVKGWVRNLPTGQVEALFEGERKDVEEMIQWCHHGPSSLGARVSKVDVRWEEKGQPMTDFQIL